jgi:PTH1 family peptidyl-tRNA hydrolase
MWLVVGLGNPGPTYRHTRHNVGFGVADRLAAAAGGRWRTAPDCVLCQVRLAGETVHLVKPHTFMNRSGQVVAPLAARHRIPAERTLLLHDDVDLPFGTLRLKAGGGHGGHNGLRSVIEETGSSDQLRVRMGIGRPAEGDDGDVVKWVLGAFRPHERAVLDDLLSRADEATRAILAQGIARAASTFNARTPTSSSS